MFTWDKNSDDVLQGLWWLCILGAISLILIIGTAVCYVGYYSYKYFKGDLIIKVVQNKQSLGNSE